MTENIYTPFKLFVLRTPFFSLNVNEKSEKFNEVFNEALFLASPDLYFEKLKEEQAHSESERMQQTLYKYKKRISNRCTPFGIFAGCSTGTIDSESQFNFMNIQDYQRRCRLDMLYLNAIIYHIEQIPEIRHQLSWVKNNSLYKIGNKYRYIEIIYTNGIKTFNISSVDCTEELDTILEITSSMCSYRQLTDALENNYEVSYEDANKFINELIDAQLIKNEISINIEGEDPLSVFLSKIDQIEELKDLYHNLYKIKNRLSLLQGSSLVEIMDCHDKLIEIIQDMGIRHNPKFVIQTDLFKPTLSSKLEKNAIDSIIDGISFLCNHGHQHKDSHLTIFKRAFIERYGDMEISLLEVLDPEIGIGYPPQNQNIDTNPLIDDIKTTPTESRLSNNIENMIYTEYHKTFNTQQQNLVLDINSSHIKDMNYSQMPNIVTVLCQLLRDKNNETIVYMKNIVGGAKLLSRFTHLDKQIWNLTQDIIDKEQELSPNCIIAEILHLPDDRCGNIIFRPLCRDYRISHLIHSTNQPIFTIPLHDLKISIKRNNIQLRSVSLNKEILPCLTTAHNYAHNSIPIYYFLCDLEFQSQVRAIGITYPQILKYSEHIPQITYKNIIFSRQKWKIYKEEIINLSDVESVAAWRERRLIPRFVLYIEHDNELAIDLNDINAIRILCNIIKKYKSIFIEEDLFYKYNSLVQTEAGDYVNEFILSFHKNKQIDR